jgi:hypothetical protein
MLGTLSLALVRPDAPVAFEMTPPHAVVVQGAAPSHAALGVVQAH